MKITYKYRIKDRNDKKLLSEWSSAVNFVWNYCKDVSLKNYKQHRKIFSGYDLNNLTSGSSKELNIPAQTIQAVCEQFAKSGKQHCKFPRWRSYKKDLGWISFKSEAFKIKDDTITFNKHQFKVWLSRPLGGPIKCGSFAQDSLGHWFVCIVCEVPEKTNKNTNSIGIDLGMKTQLTLSDGTKYSHENITKQYELLLAQAQATGNKKLVKKLYNKIKNIRNDWCHKATTTIVKNNKNIYVGNLNPTDIIQEYNRGFNKSLYDASLFRIKTMLKYKAQLLGGNYMEVSEAYSTQTCSNCGERTGPKGKEGLKIRNWICSDCGRYHDRDINAAKNILRGRAWPSGTLNNFSYLPSSREDDAMGSYIINKEQNDKSNY